MHPHHTLDDPTLAVHADHLRDAGRHDELVAIVTDARYLCRRLAQGGARGIEHDLEVAAGAASGDAAAAVHAVARRVQQVAHLLDHARAADAIPGTLLVQLHPVADHITHRDEFGNGVVPEWVVDRTSGNLRRTLGDGGEVRAVAWSPDGTHLATAGSDATVRIWDPVTSVQTGALTSSDGAGVRAVAWSPDGTHLATAGGHKWIGGDGTVRIWDAATGAQTSVLTGDELGVELVAWSPDGARVAGTGNDGTVRVWDAAAGAETAALTGYSRKVTSVAWSPDGTRVAAAAAADYRGHRTVRIWDAATGAETAALTHDLGMSVTSVAWSPDGTSLATGGAKHGDGMVWIWDLATGTQTAKPTGGAEIRVMAWSPDGALMATAHRYSAPAVRILDVATGAPVAELDGHREDIEAVAWSPDGASLATAGGRTSRIWDLSGGVEALAEAQAQQKTILHFDVRTGRVSKRRKGPRGHGHEVGVVAWSPDGAHLATAEKDSMVRLWNPATGKEMPALEGCGVGGWGLAWAPDSVHLAIEGNDGTVPIWNRDRNTLTTCLGQGGAETMMAWAPDGKQVATAGDKAVQIWDLATGDEAAVLYGHRNAVSAMAWSPDGTYLASASVDTTVRLWDPATWTETAVLTGHGKQVITVAWSPDGAHLASVGMDHTVRIWDPASWAETATLTHDRHVDRVAWSPDGRHLATAGADNMVRIWDPVTWERTATLTAHDDRLTGVTWSSDSSHVASTSADGLLQIMDHAGRESPVRAVVGEQALAASFDRSGDRIAIGSERAVMVCVFPTTESMQRHSPVLTEQRISRTIAFTQEALGTILAKEELEAGSLDGMARFGVDLAQWAAAAGSADARIDTGLAATARAGAAMFAALGAHEPLDVLFHDGRRRRVPALQPTGFATPGTWLTSFHAAMCLGDVYALDRLAAVDIASLRESPTKMAEHAYRYIEALCAYHRRDADTPDRLLTALEATEPMAIDPGARDHTLYIAVPQMWLLYHRIIANASVFNGTLATALRQHKKYWTRNEPRVLGQLAVELLGIACTATDAGLPVTVESDYIPRWIIERDRGAAAQLQR